MKKKKEHTGIVKILIVVFLIILIINIYFVFTNFSIIKNLNETPNIIQNKQEEIKELKLEGDPLSLQGFTKVFVSLNGNNIILENNCTSLTVATNEYQAYSITQGMKSIIDIRPTTHDIMVNVLNNFNITLLQSKVIENQDQHYFARTIYRQNNKILNIDKTHLQ